MRISAKYVYLPTMHLSSGWHSVNNFTFFKLIKISFCAYQLSTCQQCIFEFWMTFSKILSSYFSLIWITVFIVEMNLIKMSHKNVHFSSHNLKKVLYLHPCKLLYTVTLDFHTLCQKRLQTH
jgi:hypothetical protein